MTPEAVALETARWTGSLIATINPTVPSEIDRLVSISVDAVIARPWMVLAAYLCLPIWSAGPAQDQGYCPVDGQDRRQ